MATDRNVKVRLTLDPKGFVAGAKAAGRAVNDLRKDIDTTNDRTAWLAQSFLALGPTLSPLGAVGAGALAGLTTQLVSAGTAATVTTIAFNGIGDALKALNDYQLDPTEEHLKKLNETMAKIGPSGQQLVRVLDEMGDGLREVANLSRDKMFPGVIDGLDELKVLAPQVEQIVAKTARVLGGLSRDAGKNLAGAKFADFFDFLEADAVPIIRQMGRTIGNIADGFAAMLVAFSPLSRDFSKGMLEMSRSFADWAHGLRDNDSFQDFIDFIRENTPRVLDLFGQLVKTIVEIGEAAAPIGEFMVPVLTDILKVVAALADTPLGPVFIATAAAIGLYGRAAALAKTTTNGLSSKIAELSLGFGKLEGSAARGERAIGKWKVSLGRSAATAGALAFAVSPLPEKFGLTNAAMGAMTGALLGPWGAAVGAGVGLMFDLAKGHEKFQISSEEIATTLDAETGAVTSNTYAYVLNSAAKQGILEDARTLGIDAGTLADAMLGEADAIRVVNAELDKYGTKNAEFGDRVNPRFVANKEAADHLSEAIDTTNGELDEGRDNLLLVGDALDTTTDKFTVAKVEVDHFADAIDALDEKLNKRDRWDAYQASIDKVVKTIKENKGNVTLDPDKEVGRQNRGNLSEFARSVKAIAETLKGQSRVNFLKDARNEFDILAEKLKLNKDEAQLLWEQLGLIGLVKATPTIKVNGVDKAREDVLNLDRGLRNLPHHRQVTVAFRTVGKDRVNHMLDRLNRNGGEQYADGGYTGPGGKYEPAGLVHRGEFVFSSEATKGNVAMLAQLHSHLRGYANGGYVAATAQPATPPMAGIDYDRLATAMLRARPLYGDVTVQGDGAFERQMRLDAMLAAKGGG